MRFRSLIATLSTIVVLVGTVPGPARAQELSRLNAPWLLQYGAANPVDLLSAAGNPAWLYERQQLRPLKVQLMQQSASGDYHAAFDPRNSTRYQYSVEGQKELSADHVVYGVFGVVQEFRKNWMWSDTKSYDTGNPLLIADSSTGSTDFRGLVLNGTYSGRMSDLWLIGATLRYGVDNGVKRISPKPLTSQRNIGLEFGTVFLLSEHVSLGATLVLKNEKEENDFEADQTLIQAQTVLYKFRGYDSYQQFTKNSENRIVRAETYGGHVQASYAGKEGASSVLSAGMTVRSANVVDGGSSPVEQGYWQSEITDASWTGTWSPVESVTVCANAQWASDHEWTRHPQFDVRLTEQHIATAQGGVLVSVPVFGESLFGGYSVARRERQLDDYLSALSAEMLSYAHTVTLGARVMMNEKKALRLWYAWEALRPASSRINVPNPSPLFAYVGAKNFAFETARSTGSAIGAEASFDGGIFGQCCLSAVFRHRTAHAAVWFEGATRTGVDVSLSTEF